MSEIGSEDALESGRRLLERLDPEGESARGRAALEELVPGFDRLTVEFAYGRVRSREGLDQRSRELATVAALCALGRERQLAVHLGYALNLGLSRRELAEAILGLGLYGGWPVAVNGLSVLREVLDRRSAGRASLGGGTTVTVISDGHAPLPAATFASGLGEEERREAETLLGAPLGDPIAVPLNPAVVEHDGRLIVIDPGAGPHDAPTAGGLVAPTQGRFLERLAAAGYRADEVDMVLLTHLHQDHAGVLALDPFPNAEIVLAGTELDHWRAGGGFGASSLPPEILARLTEISCGLADAIADRARSIADGDRIVDGLSAIAVPGHTPGQLAFLLEGADRSLLFVADTICHELLSVRFPDAGHAADFDPDLGIESRQRMLTLASERELLVHGFHLPTPGLGRVVGEEGAFEWDPV